MSFVFAERMRRETDGMPIGGISIYGDTKIELAGAVKASWPPVARSAVLKYGVCKVTIPCSNLCISFAGNNLLNVSRLFTWMEKHSPFEVDALIEIAYELHLESESGDDIEWIICESDRTPSGRIMCIKDRQVQEDCEIAWIGSRQTFREMQRIRSSQMGTGSGTLSLFAQAIRSSADDSVGGFVINAALRDGAFQYNEYLFTQVYKEHQLMPGESMSMIDSKENGGYTVEACDAEGQPLLCFPQIGKGIVYTNRFRYRDEAPLDPNIKFFYLPMLIDIKTGRSLEI